MKNIYNAYIKNWWLKKEEGTLLLKLEIRSTEGTAIINVLPNEIEKLFNVLHILDIKELKNAPCIALVTDRIIRTIGNFMFLSVENIYSDKERINELDSKHWLDYNIYLKYKDK